MQFLKFTAAAAALLGQASAFPPGPGFGFPGGGGGPDSQPDRDGCVDSEAAYIRSYFYVGGGYVDDGSGGHIFRDQMYVEKLLPTTGVSQDTPIVLIHGQAQTGSVSFADLSQRDPPSRCHNIEYSLTLPPLRTSTTSPMVVEVGPLTL